MQLKLIQLKKLNYFFFKSSFQKYFKLTCIDNAVATWLQNIAIYKQIQYLNGYIDLQNEHT